jgi:hypothetical protein
MIPRLTAEAVVVMGGNPLNFSMNVIVPEILEEII